MTDPTNPGLSRYDQVLYPSYTRVQTHPDRAATIATLLGMTPAPVETCRFLEIGCGNGSNLCPIAYGLPGGRFVGLDSASIPIARAREMAGSLGLVNVTFHLCDIQDAPADLGEFDYIVAHGVYSWVPRPVRDKLLEACARHLAPQGVAFVSYNAYPGNYLNQMIRSMLLYHVRGFDDAKQQVAQGIALAKFIAESQPGTDSYRQLVKEELERFVRVNPNYVFHDALADINEPSYFYEFVEHAARYHLKYLAEADFHEMLDRQFKPDVARTLDQIAGDRIEREQYLDFLKCRRFRQTLLCREQVRLDLSLKPQLASRFFAASAAQAVAPQPDIYSDAVETFQGPKGASIRTNSPISKAAFLVLAELWPQPLQFDDLLEQVRAQIRQRTGQEPANREESALELGKTLMQSYAAGLAELHSYQPPCARTIGVRPLASPLARWQAQNVDYVTTLYHNTLVLADPLAKQLLPLLDGTRDRSALTDELMRLNPSQGGPRTPAVATAGDPQQMRIFMAARLEENLLKLARSGLLVERGTGEME